MLVVLLTKVTAALVYLGWWEKAKLRRCSDEDVPKDRLLEVVLSLKQHGISRLYSELRAVSSPESYRYLKFLSTSEVSRLVGRSPDELAVLRGGLVAAFPSISQISVADTKDFVAFRAQRDDIEAFIGGPLGCLGEFSTGNHGSSLFITPMDAEPGVEANILVPELDIIDFVSFYTVSHQFCADPWGKRSCEKVVEFALPTERLEILETTQSIVDGSGSRVAIPILEDFKIPTDAVPPFVVGPGTRGLADVGQINIVPLSVGGPFFMNSDTDPSEGLTHFGGLGSVLDSADYVELLVNQEGVSNIISIPINGNWTDCETRGGSVQGPGIVFEPEHGVETAFQPGRVKCSYEDREGFCLLLTLRFTMKPFIKTTVNARAKLHSGERTSWDVGLNSEFYSNVVADHDKLLNHYKAEKLDGEDSPIGNRPLLVTTGFLEEYYDPEDLQMSVLDSGLSPNLLNSVIDFGPNQRELGRKTGVEASLDVQILTQWAGHSADILFWSTPGREVETAEPFIRFFSQVSMLNSERKKLPTIISFSYGDEDFSLDPDRLKTYIQRLDVEVAKLGVMGVTTIAASGDDGAIGMRGRKANRPERCDFASPAFPPSLPSITSVGASSLTTKHSRFCAKRHTQLPPTPHAPCDSVGEVVASTEAAGSTITSGGGFSNVFLEDDPLYGGVMSYQRSSVQKWFELMSIEHSGYLESMPPNFFQKRGRGYPDLVTIGTNVPVVLDRKWLILSGTSISAPLLAGIIANLLERLPHNCSGRLAEGRLGFMNPLLYQLAVTKPSVFRDITVGDNRCGYKNIACCPKGFPATTGWDPASGLGGIDIDKMLRALQACQIPMESEVQEDEDHIYISR